MGSLTSSAKEKIKHTCEVSLRGERLRRQRENAGTNTCL